MNSGNDFTKHIHVKNIIRLLSILLMVFFFVPSFMVSCAGYGNIKISAFKAMTGIKIEGESVSDPKVICIIMPAASNRYAGSLVLKERIKRQNCCNRIRKLCSC